MDDVKRWTRQDPRNSGRRVDMVLASDYDALRARVEEAERLLRLAVEDTRIGLPEYEGAAWMRDSLKWLGPSAGDGQ